MATADEIIVKLTADSSGMNVGMDEAAAKVKASTDAMSASLADSMAQFSAFDAIQKNNIKTAADLASAQQTLTDVQATGAFTTEELAAKQAIVAAAMSNVGSETKAAAGALRGFTSNSRTMYSASALITDAMTGQFSRMRREVAALTNETGVLSSAFSFLLSPAGLVSIAIAGIAVEAYKASQAIDALAKSAQAGGGFVGLSPGDMEQIADGFKNAGYSINDTRAAMGKLAASGRITGGELKQATEASLDYARITGEQADKLAEQFSHMGEGGLQAIYKVNEGYHFLTGAQFDQIAALEKSGKTTEAAAKAYDYLDVHAESALQKIQEQTGKTEGGFAALGTKLANASDSIGKFFDPASALTYNDQLARINTQIGALNVAGGKSEESEKTINGLLQKRAELVAKIAEEKREAAQVGRVEQAEADRESHIMKPGKVGKGGKVDEAAFQKKEYDDQKSGHEMSLAEEKAFWQQRLDIDNKKGAEGAEAAQTAMGKIVEIQKQIDNKKLESARKGSEAAKRADQEQLGSMRDARSGMLSVSQAVTSQIIAQDQKIVDFAKAHYKELPNAYRSALNQMRADQKAFAQQVREIDFARLTGQKQIAQSQEDFQREVAQTQYDNGQISAQRLLQIELDLNQKKFASDLALLNARLALDKGNVKASIQDQTQITLATQEASQQRQKIIMDEAAKELQIRQRVAREEARLVAQSVNQILFSNQSLKQSLANIGEQVLFQFIEKEANKVEMAWSSVGEQNAAIIFGAGVQVSTAATAAATTKAINKSTNQDQISSAAATGAAKAYQAIVGIPYVGPILAPIAAAVAFAGIEAFASSAEGGWERVPADGMMTRLHYNEMVLPAHVAEPVRQMAAKGGSGGDIHHHHYSFQAYDERGIKDLIRRNMKDIAAGAQHMRRRGY